MNTPSKNSNKHIQPGYSTHTACDTVPGELPKWKMKPLEEQYLGSCSVVLVTRATGVLIVFRNAPESLTSRNAAMPRVGGGRRRP